MYKEFLEIEKVKDNNPIEKQVKNRQFTEREK